MRTSFTCSSSRRNVRDAFGLRFCQTLGMKIDLKSALADDPKASVLLLHGFAEHQGRYKRLIADLNAGGYDVYSYDQRGHGRAPGKRAVVDVGALIKDHLQARKLVRQMCRTERLFLFGHSMGGLITAASALIDAADVSGVVLSGPAFAPYSHVDTDTIKKLLKLASVFPGAPVGMLDPEHVSRLPEVVEDYKNDPLNYHGPMPALTGMTMMVQGQEVLQRAHQWVLPLLIFHGSEDMLANVDASWQFVATATAAGVQAEMVEVPGAYHEVFNEPEAGMLTETMIAWLDQQVRGWSFY